MQTELRITVSDLEAFPEDGSRYEIIDGELYVSKPPHWRHQLTCDQVGDALRRWSKISGDGVAVTAPGLIFAESEAVAPDLVWVSRERLSRTIGDDGKLHTAPELVVEVLSPGRTNDHRDRDVKLKLYSRRGVLEYWVVDWQAIAVQVYRRENGALQLATTLYEADSLTSPLLPGFSVTVGELCAAPI